MPIFTPTSSADEKVEKLKIAYFSNEFPKDDLSVVARQILNQTKERAHPLLSQFISEATWAIRDEVQRIPHEFKLAIPPTETVLEWVAAAELRAGPLCSAVDGVLLCVVQLAAYIGYLERLSDDFEGANDYTCLAGLGIGLLGAAAVATSQSLAHLPFAGADAVRLAFRLGVHVALVSDCLEPADTECCTDSWAYVVHNVGPDEVQQECDVVNKASPAPSKIFISAVSRTSVTISGPPARLTALFKTSAFFRESRYIPLPVYGGLCHAPHIYGQRDMDTIVDAAALYSGGRTAVLPLYCTSTGQQFTELTAVGLFKQVVGELLTKPIFWDKVIDGLIEHASSITAQECEVQCFRKSIPLYDLTKAMKLEPLALEPMWTDILDWISHIPAKSKPQGPKHSKIAIVGMSCRLPGGATDNEKFWQVLEDGLDVSRKIPSDRFDIASHFDPSGKSVNKSGTEYMCAIDEPGLFDAPFFNMSPREAAQTDPMMRLALSTSYEALEQAGFVANRTRSTNLNRIGTYYGQASDDYREVNQGQEVSTYYIPGGCRAFGPGKINYFFKFSGPSYSIDTACSSSLATIQVACSAIWNGDVDMAVAGGMNVLTNSDGFAGLCDGYFLTRGHNACKTWDATADGYCRADGVGSVVLKKLEDAEADNDNILGVILSAGTNHSAEAVSITHPHAGAQSYLYRQVVRQAGIDPLDISYVEMHGTGTQAGDKTEIKSITDVFAPSTGHCRTVHQPLHIGAVKANVGHGEAVAGVTALIKTLLMLKKDMIPKHIGIKTELNPEFPKDLEKRGVRIPYEQTPWSRKIGKTRLAVVNNFGAAGGNSTLILQEGSIRTVDAQADPRPTHVVTVSAKNKVSLKANIDRLLAYLGDHDVELRDLSYTTTARRHHHAYRINTVSSDMNRLKTQLLAQLSSIDSTTSVSAQPPIAFVFTGQGASYKSMSLELYRESSVFRDHIDRLDFFARSQGFPSFVPAIDGSHQRDFVHSPVVTQLALVSTEIALAKYWSNLGIKPDLVMGHSLGEYAAMHVAGVLSANEAIALVGHRAEMLVEKCTLGSHIMMAVRAPLTVIQQSLEAREVPFTIACINGPEDIVLSGTQSEMDAAAKALAPAKCIKLDVAFAFHSEQTNPILDDFEEFALSAAVFREPRLPVVSPLLGKVVFDGKTLNANYVRRATREPVDFSSALSYAMAIETVTKDTLWIEVGPHPVCTSFVKSIVFPSAPTTVPSMRRGENNWTTLANSLSCLHKAGVEIAWNEFHKPFEAALRLLDLPSYAWNDKNYWIQYNGDWNLKKGNTFYQDTSDEKLSTVPRALSSLSTSLVQRIIEENIDTAKHQGSIMMQADMMQPDFLAAAHGHRMNGCGVVTSSIHADIAYTMGHYLYKNFNPKVDILDINIAELHVNRGLVAQKDTKTPQNIRVEGRTADARTGTIDLFWYNVDVEGKHNANDPFATAKVYCENRSDWQKSWFHTTHLVHGRIEELDRLAAQGIASRFSGHMAYTIWASTLVDYAPKYRGMQAVVLHELEAYADVQLTIEKGGQWTVPPFFVDSVAHLAGFIMNCSDCVDYQKNFFVTSGWDSMRFAKPLIAGASYRSYVKMIPTDSTNYVGDVYVFQDSEIIGMVGGIRFRQYPRVLMDRFFSAPDSGTSHNQSSTSSKTAPQASPVSLVKRQALPPTPPETVDVEASDVQTNLGLPTLIETKKSNIEAAAPAAAPAAPIVTNPPASDSTAARAVKLIAKEAALEESELTDEDSFANLGVDSLMSLVISEKLRTELGVTVTGSLFLDYPTIGDLREWLLEAYA